MVTLFVRVQPKKGEKFFRCGIEFIRAWRKVDVDEATATRLRSEQMLEVTDQQPADYEEPQADVQAKAEADNETAAAKGGKKK